MPAADAVPAAVSGGSVLAFRRCGQAYCCPVAEVMEIVEEPVLSDPGTATPLLAGVLLHDGLFIPVVDPACILDQPAGRDGDGDVILMQGNGAVVGLLADAVLGFRRPLSASPAPWIPAGRLCRSAVMLEEIGRAFLLGAEGLGDVPTAVRAAEATASPVEAGPPLHLVYGIAGRTYASAYADVERILFRQPMVRVPGGRPPVEHVVEMSGAVVPVLELAAAEEGGERSHFVVLGSPLGPLALRVDAIDRPLPLEQDGADPDWFPSPGVSGVGRNGERAIALVTGAALVRDLIGGEAA